MEEDKGPVKTMLPFEKSSTLIFYMILIRPKDAFAQNCFFQNRNKHKQSDTLKKCLHKNEIQNVILTDKKWVFILKQFQSIYRAE